MSRSRKQGSRFSQSLIVVLTTLFIVGGIALAATLNQQINVGVKDSSGSQQKTSSISSQEKKEVPFLLLANDSALTIVHPDGRFERTSYAAFELKYADQMRWPSFGSDAATGSMKPFVIRDGEDQPDPVGFRSPKGVYWAKIAPAKMDEATVIELKRGKEAPQALVLRMKDGKGLKNGQLYGWFNDESLMVTAMATSTMSVFAADLNGQVRSLGALPEQVLFSSALSGALYAVTGNQDQGIEIAPKGPSEVFAFSANRSFSGPVLHSESLISSILPDPHTKDSRFAFVTDTGKAYVTKGDDQVELGKLRPLLFLASGELIVRDGYDIAVHNVETGTSTRIGALPEGSVTVFPFNP